jgi:endonuclease/exonuclease/phosphatase family metal-dependent hydrolase
MTAGAENRAFTEGEGEEIHLTALTLNLRFGLAADGANSWPHRRRAVLALLAAFPVDFMAFQEVNDFQADELHRALPTHDAIGQRRPAPPFWQNNLIFFHRRWRCDLVMHFYLSPTPTLPSRSRRSRWPRQCSLGLFSCKDRRIACVSTHFDFDSAVQVASARQIQRTLQIIPAPFPVLLMGDFNAAPESPCHTVFTAPKPGSAYRRFQSVFSPPYPGTHHGFSGTSTGDHIDWILYSGSIIPVGCRIVRDRFENRYPSDHFPLYARFKWTSRLLEPAAELEFGCK